MKYKLLAVGTEPYVNIGDYVQALASAQFFPTIDGFIEREKLKDYNGEECVMIMNGWYMYRTEQWPPSPKIHPLFYAFHINSTVKERMLSDESIVYLKNHEPIGCRDTNTMNLLRNKGVDAYFSGCMTLTLGYKYKSEEKEDKCYFVDPYFNFTWNFKQVLKASLCFCMHPNDIFLITRKYRYSYQGKGLKKLLKIAAFYNEYSKFFTPKTLVDAEYISQQDSFYKNDFPTNEDRLKEAERLIMKYAKAKLVVTSRIHCALPCLGMETPVIYIENKLQDEASSCRLGGLEQLFTIFYWHKGRLKPQGSLERKISINHLPVNKNLWKNIAVNLITSVRQKLMPYLSENK